MSSWNNTARHIPVPNFPLHNSRTTKSFYYLSSLNDIKNPNVIPGLHACHPRITFMSFRKNNQYLVCYKYTAYLKHLHLHFAITIASTTTMTCQSFPQASTRRFLAPLFAWTLSLLRWACCIDDYIMIFCIWYSWFSCIIISTPNNFITCSLQFVWYCCALIR